jgi:hypothetical protein
LNNGGANPVPVRFKFLFESVFWLIKTRTRDSIFLCKILNCSIIKF